MNLASFSHHQRLAVNQGAAYKENLEILFLMKDSPKGYCLFVAEALSEPCKVLKLQNKMRVREEEFLGKFSYVGLTYN